MWKIVFPLLAALFAVGLGGMVGGPADIDVNDEGVRKALGFAVEQHNKANNDMYNSEVAEVVKAQRQLVAGLKYVITANMRRTSCRKGKADDCGTPSVQTMARPYQCTFTVWYRPWLNQNDLLDQQCH